MHARDTAKCNLGDRDVIMISMRYVSDEHAGTPKSLDDSLGGQQLLLDCGICGQQFPTKKQLRIHINTHLRKPRIVLKRVTGPKAKVVCTQSDTYWLDPETKGSLKLTLKKQSIAESLKLTLRKKSSESADFTVVHSNFNLVRNHQQRDVAGAKENDRRDDKPTENSVNKPFENVMVDQQVSSLLDNVMCKVKISVCFLQ